MIKTPSETGDVMGWSCVGVSNGSPPGDRASAPGSPARDRLLACRVVLCIRTVPFRSALDTEEALSRSSGRLPSKIGAEAGELLDLMISHVRSFSTLLSALFWAIFAAASPRSIKGEVDWIGGRVDAVICIGGLGGFNGGSRSLYGRVELEPTLPGDLAGTGGGADARGTCC